MVKAEISSNQWYGAINRRFNRRSRLLRRLGYKYMGTPFGAMFVRSRGGCLESIQVGFVQSADNRSFIGCLRSPMSSRIEKLEGIADSVRERLSKRVFSFSATIKF
jgi:hypothetical protein